MARLRILCSAILFLGMVLFPLMGGELEWTLNNDFTLTEQRTKNPVHPSVISSGFSLDVPIDHFNVSDERTFRNHYWLNDTFYQRGGPVFFFDTGTHVTRHHLLLFPQASTAFDQTNTWSICKLTWIARWAWCFRIHNFCHAGRKHGKLELNIPSSEVQWPSYFMGT